MAASKEQEATTDLQGEARGWHTIGGLHGGYKREAAIFLDEEPEKGSVAAVAEAKAADESGIGDEAAPLLADQRDMREGGRLRGKAEEDLGKQVIVFQRRRRRAREAAHLALSSRLNF
jgi:hypothetical protein